MSAEDDFALRYDRKLAELTFNSKPIINALTMIAGENRVFAERVAVLLRQRLLAEPNAERRLPFLYLLDATLEAEGLGPLLECLADVALERLLRFALRLGRGAARDALLRDHALCFLAYCAHRFARVRRVAFRSVVSSLRSAGA